MILQEKVSIIIPLYKVEEYLHTCLDSVLAQDYPYWEAILVDDGSPDHCGDIAEEYAVKDGRFRVIHQENGGLSAARNTGMQAATGKYLMFMDSDDWWPYPQLLSKLVAEMQRGPWDIINFNAEVHDHTGVYLFVDLDEEATTAELQRKMYLHQMLETVWNKIYRCSLWEGIKFPVGGIIEDYYVMPEVFSRAKRIRNWDFIGYAYNQMNADSITSRFPVTRHAWTLRGALHHLALIEQGVLPNDAELIRQKQQEVGKFALRVLVAKAGGANLRAHDVQIAQEELAAHPEWLSKRRYRLLNSWRQNFPFLFTLYGKVIWTAKKWANPKQSFHKRPLKNKS